MSENTHEWVWDAEGTTRGTLLKHANQEVCFHPTYSSGTAAVRGNMPCIAGRDYFWEIEMLTPLYGTDVMVGVGTLKTNLKKFQFHFGSLLGSDKESWGYSYNGKLYHNGKLRQYISGFRHGNIVGVHLDMWQGTLTFYLNREPLGVAFTSLKAHILYPMVCSTAARSAMRIVCSYSYTSSLQLLCLKSIGCKPYLVQKMQTIPGLRGYTEEAFWHFFPRSCSLLGKGGVAFHLCLEDEDSDVDDGPDFPRSIIPGECHPAVPISLSKKQPTKRSSVCEESTEINFPEHKEDFCVICRRPERTNAQTTGGQGSSSKRMCFVCDILF